MNGDQGINKSVKTHLRYFWLGIASKAFWQMMSWLTYCFAPTYFHFTMKVAAWWYLFPFGLLILVLIYCNGKYIARKRDE